MHRISISLYLKYLHLLCFSQMSHYRQAEVSQKCLWFQMGWGCSDPAPAHILRTPGATSPQNQTWMKMCQRPWLTWLYKIYPTLLITRHIPAMVGWQHCTFPQHDTLLEVVKTSPQDTRRNFVPFWLMMGWVYSKLLGRGSVQFSAFFFTKALYSYFRSFISCHCYTKADSVTNY